MAMQHALVYYKREETRNHCLILSRQPWLTSYSVHVMLRLGLLRLTIAICMLQDVAYADWKSDWKKFSGGVLRVSSINVSRTSV